MVKQVQIPHSVVEGKEPLPGEIEVAGLAVNLVDYSLFTKGYDGKVIRLNGTVVVEDNAALDAVVYPTWVAEAGGKALLQMSSTKLSFNPLTGKLAAASFSGDGSELTGFKAVQITGALGYPPVKPMNEPLGAAASDLATVITLANKMRQALINCGIGT